MSTPGVHAAASCAFVFVHEQGPGCRRVAALVADVKAAGWRPVVTGRQPDGSVLVTVLDERPSDGPTIVPPA